MRGKKVSPETKNKLSLSKLGKPSGAKGKVHITNDIEDKMVPENELESYLNSGWRRGRKKFSREACENISIGHRGATPKNLNKICVNKDGLNKFIEKGSLNEYLNNGWHTGMLFKNRGR